MRTPAIGILWVCLISITTPALAQTDSEIEALRAELAQMRADYESRIAQLEKRLDEAEKKSEERQATAIQAQNQLAAQPESWPAGSPGGQMTGSAGNSMNPSIGVIFQGQAWNYQNDPDEYEIPGFPLGGKHQVHTRSCAAIFARLAIAPLIDCLGF